MKEKRDRKKDCERKIVKERLQKKGRQKDREKKRDMARKTGKERQRKEDRKKCRETRKTEKQNIQDRCQNEVSQEE